MNLAKADKIPGMVNYDELEMLALWASKSKNIIEVCKSLIPALY